MPLQKPELAASVSWLQWRWWRGALRTQGSDVSEHKYLCGEDCSMRGFRVGMPADVSSVAESAVSVLQSGSL